VLVETAFISNPREEKLLRTSAYQDKIATALMKGVRSYFRDNAPDDSLLASLNQKSQG
jgi:N-acetylmuramoyl-L-alanine amidase